MTIQEVNLETAKGIQAFLVAKGYLSEHLPLASRDGYTIEVSFIEVEVYFNRLGDLVVAFVDNPGVPIATVNPRYATIKLTGSLIAQALEVELGSI